MEILILSARVFTGDPKRPWVEAIGIRNREVVAVGRNEEVRRAFTQGAEIFELPGRLVVPGLVDAHLHFVNLGLYLERLDLRDLPSIEACRKRVKEAVAKRKPGEWIIGRGWDQHLWKERREPTRQDLDDLAPHHPVMLVRACGHSIWVNSLVLAKAGITKHTSEPPGTRIERDPRTGEPTGLLREYRKIIEKQIPPSTLEERRRAALLAQDEALRFGVTGVHSSETLQHWEALASLEKEGRLKVRVHHLLPPEELEAAAARGIFLGKGSDRLWFGQVKLYADGTLGSGTALLHEPYADNPSERGLAVLTPDDLQNGVELAYRFGGDVGIHAIGDRALTHSLKAIEAARRHYPGPRLDRIEHAQLFRPRDLPLFRGLGVIASVQPVHLLTDRSVAEKRWGRDRCRYAYAWRSLLKAGIKLQLGSDAPVESINPLLSFQAAATRQDLSGEPPGGWFPEERLTLEEIIQGFTLVPASVSRKGDRLGSLAPGKWADLTVFSRDLFDLSPENWSSVEAEMTVINGEVLYQKTTGSKGS